MTTIDRVERIPLFHELEEPFANGQGFVKSREYLLVRVIASDGAVGYGECIGPVAGNDQIIDRLLGPALVGTDAAEGPATLTRIGDDLRRRFKSYVPYGAVGGVEIALWDLRGKLLGRSVGDLLGGRHHERVPAYVTGHYFRGGLGLDDQVGRIEDEARGHVARGFRRVKLKLGLHGVGYGRDADARLMERLRLALTDDVALMADANCAYDLMQARRVGRCAQELGYEWFEEPLPATDLVGYAALARELDIPVSAGESWGDPAVFGAALRERAVDLIQPDMVAAGGIEAVRRVLALAEAHGVAAQPHVWGTAVVMAAALQVLTARATSPLFEFDASPNPVRDGLLGGQLPLGDDGTVDVPSGPGLGIEIPAEALERFRDRR
ncbi:mandelate racemase/muconate lactonizing enzyme family protein [Micromonospora sp. NBC_00389]|uniref:mandelate racemase/muconate lactonizing enzyme family protein n=1 Tax=Micromonospora sp. NBC_00389 TaxID=2903586 RepID=UPI002E1CCEF3